MNDHEKGTLLLERLIHLVSRWICNIKVYIKYVISLFETNNT